MSDTTPEATDPDHGDDPTDDPTDNPTDNPDVQQDPADDADQDAGPTTMAPPGEGPDAQGQAG
jgi:hypothetical protein